jgi:uncharacterized protein (DUF427 family)
MKAVWNNATLAESNDTVIVEGNHYFPADSIRSEHFEPSETHTVCPWKGRPATITSSSTVTQTATPHGITR